MFYSATMSNWYLLPTKVQKDFQLLMLFIERTQIIKIAGIWPLNISTFVSVSCRPSRSENGAERYEMIDMELLTFQIMRLIYSFAMMINKFLGWNEDCIERRTRPGEWGIYSYLADFGLIYATTYFKFTLKVLYIEYQFFYASRRVGNLIRVIPSHPVTKFPTATVIVFIHHR